MTCGPILFWPARTAGWPLSRYRRNMCWMLSVVSNTQQTRPFFVFFMALKTIASHSMWLE